MRYTNEQRNLAEGMEILIKLYYRLKETDKKDWLADSVVKLVGECAYKVIPTFKKCLYIKNPYHPRLKFYSPKGGVMNIIEKDFRVFVYAMDAFSREDRKDIITVEGISHEFKRENYSILRQKVVENVAIPKKVYRDSKNYRFQSFITGVRDETPGEGHYNGLVSHPIYREIIHFRAYGGSNFVNTLYHSFPVSDKQITPPLKIKRKNRFLDLLQYFFVKYIDVFDSFDRIALCDYKPCGKLVYKIRYDKRKFCCDKCKLDNHKALQDNDKRLCKEKQNTWIRRKFTFEFTTRHKNEIREKPYTVLKSRCDKCNGPVDKGGLCPILRDLNEKAFKIFEDEKNRPKTRRIPGLEFNKHFKPTKK